MAGEGRVHVVEVPDPANVHYLTQTTLSLDEAGRIIEALKDIGFDGLAEIFNALWAVDMEITLFEEHDSVPWPALGDQMVDLGGGEFRLADRPERLPHSYTLRARRR